jgi:hypothetical protein
VDDEPFGVPFVDVRFFAAPFFGPSPLVLAPPSFAAEVDAVFAAERFAGADLAAVPFAPGPPRAPARVAPRPPPAPAPFPLDPDERPAAETFRATFGAFSAIALPIRGARFAT